MKVRITKDCIDQDTKKRLKKGRVHEFVSDFELGHHLAFGNCELYERAVKKTPEKRRKYGRRVKNGSEADSTING